MLTKLSKISIKRPFLVLMVVLLNPFMLLAAESTAPNTKDKKSIDEIIVNPKLRAESGSESKWSLATKFNYQGGSIKKPFSSERPNVFSENNTPTVSALSGTLSGRYRFDKKTYLSFGFGLRLEQPFSSGGREDLDDPIIQYGRVYKVFGIQNHSFISYKVFTKEFSRDLGYQSVLTLLNSAAYKINKRFTFGLVIFGKIWSFDKKTEVVDMDDMGNPVSAEELQVNYRVSIFPFAEYYLNKKLNVRTSFGRSFSHERTESKALKFRRNTFTQSVGFGVSLTRDVFLYPNVLFTPEDIKSEKTNIGLSATVNLF